MKRALLILTVLMMSVASLSAKDAFAQISGLPTAELESNVASLPEVVFWWFDNCFLVPANQGAFESAIEDEWSKLNPGETKVFRIVVGGSKERPVFRHLDPDGNGIFLPANTWVTGKIAISRREFVYTPETPTVDPPQESFEIWKRRYSGSPVTYDDFRVACNTIINLSGFGTIDLREKNVFAPFDGTVILVARAEDSEYNVFNVASNSKDSSGYAKGAAIERLGTTVWVLSDDRKYVAVASELARENVEPGDRVSRGRTKLGNWRDYGQATFRLYRIFSSDQYFLGGDEEPRPVRLIPSK